MGNVFGQGFDSPQLHLTGRSKDFPVFIFKLMGIQEIPALFYEYTNIHKLPDPASLPCLSVFLQHNLADRH